MSRDAVPILLQLPAPAGYLRKCDAGDLAPLSAFLDAVLNSDAFFRRGHLRSVLEDPRQDVYAVLLDDVLCGVVIMYDGTTLHNIVLSPSCRGAGVGTAIIRALQPGIVRAKTNMAAGDPTAFYERNGFETVGRDPSKPHIGIMVKTPSRKQRTPEQRERNRQRSKERRDQRRQQNNGRPSKPAAPNDAGAAISPPGGP